MNDINDMMTSILSRVLSEELAHQENWKAYEKTKGWDGHINRDDIINEVKQFMDENNIPFAEHWYFNELEV